MVGHHLHHSQSHSQNIVVPPTQDLLRAEATRVTQLVIHGVILFVTGGLLNVSPIGSPAFVLARTLPGWPWLYGTACMLIAINLLYWVMWRKTTRGITYSLVLVAASYFAFGMLFLTNVGVWIAQGFVEPPPVAYPIGIYFGLFSFVLLHMEASKPVKKKERLNGKSRVR